MVCKKWVIYGFLDSSWVLITTHLRVIAFMSRVRISVRTYAYGVLRSQTAPTVESAIYRESTREESAESFST